MRVVVQLTHLAQLLANGNHTISLQRVGKGLSFGVPLQSKKKTKLWQNYIQQTFVSQ